jgi:hypothetical protein
MDKISYPSTDGLSGGVNPLTFHANEMSGAAW